MLSEMYLIGSLQDLKIDLAVEFLPIFRALREFVERLDTFFELLSNF